MAARAQDKQAQEAYKSDIKAQLTREGKIRGQPKQRRTPPDGLSPYAMHTDPRLLAACAGPQLDFGSLDMFGLPLASPYLDPTALGQSPFGRWRRQRASASRTG